MTVRIAVAGGTGTVGRYVVESARGAGHDVVVLSRSAGVDVMDASALARALQHVDAIVDVTDRDASDEAAAAEFFTTVARNLQVAGAEQRVEHVLTLSIVGIDRFTTGYYAAKREQERVALAGPVPATILRATQFHEFPAQVLHSRRRHGIARIPNPRVRTVAACSVGRVLVELATGAPRGLAGELAGPEESELIVLALAFAERRGLEVDVVVDEESRIPERALLPAAGARIEGPTFEEWLASDDALALPV